MKTLAMIKMEKNFTAIEKGYPRRPYDHYNIRELIDRLEQEHIELVHAFLSNNFWNMLFELADISNIVDYIFEQVTVKLEKKERDVDV